MTPSDIFILSLMGLVIILLINSAVLDHNNKKYRKIIEMQNKKRKKPIKDEAVGQLNLWEE